MHNYSGEITTNNWLVAGVLVVVYLAIAGIALVGTKQFPVKGVGLAKCEVGTPHTKYVPYAATEYYTEKVPSQASSSPADPPTLPGSLSRSECSDVTYTTNECVTQELAYAVTEKKCFRSGWNETWANVECTFKNNDSVGADFNLFAGFAIGPDTRMPVGSWGLTSQMGKNMKVYLDSSSTYTLDYNMYTSFNTPLICYCRVIAAPTKQVCGDVQKTKQQCREVVSYNVLSGDASSLHAVANYTTTTKSRIVTHYREETGYEVSDETC